MKPVIKIGLASQLPPHARKQEVVRFMKKLTEKGTADIDGDTYGARNLQDITRTNRMLAKEISKYGEEALLAIIEDRPGKKPLGIVAETARQFKIGENAYGIVAVRSEFTDSTSIACDSQLILIDDRGSMFQMIFTYFEQILETIERICRPVDIEVPTNFLESALFDHTVMKLIKGRMANLGSVTIDEDIIDIMTALFSFEPHLTFARLIEGTEFRGLSSQTVTEIKRRLRIQSIYDILCNDRRDDILAFAREKTEEFIRQRNKELDFFITQAEATDIEIGIYGETQE